ncbi:hypothetical protein GJ744_002697 [Endocarpon pusillum]|uniref:beta-glucosidase n=1 Tax=Endocarpon pusillum TaxID=364733 RepID=A0A8H7AR28_9EURO|nr:hypothetical protein GJ744_002697 [Endocarpon pusillum]
MLRVATSASPSYPLIGECCIFGFELHAAAFVELQLEVPVMAKGAHVILGPVPGPLGRVALGARNREDFSPDPYLSGGGMKETITGLQSVGLQACAKHFILNEQESQRNPSFPNGTMQYSDPLEATIRSVSGNADDRTTHELYLWPFADAVKVELARRLTP